MYSARTAAAEAAAAAVRSGAKGAWQGHSGAVSGVAVDAVNHSMVSAGVDGLLVFWAFKEKRANGAVAVGSGVSQLELVSGGTAVFVFFMCVIVLCQKWCHACKVFIVFCRRSLEMEVGEWLRGSKSCCSWGGRWHCVPCCAFSYKSTVQTDPWHARCESHTCVGDRARCRANVHA